MKNKIYLGLSIALVIFWMVTVFILSGEIATNSRETSGNVISWLIGMVNKNITLEEMEKLVTMLQPIIRKCAHFILYVTGGILIYNLCLQFNNIKYVEVVSIILGGIYAITDEIHQLFVEGRSGEVRDVLIDISGVTVGVMCLYFLLYIIKVCKKKFNNI